MKYIQKLQALLPQIALKLRQRLYPHDKALILSMDATSHEQYSDQMEGVEWNYKKFRSLDSQNVFDQYGFCYGWHLRAGNTHSSVGTVEMLSQIVNNIKTDKKIYFRADSAYSNQETYNYLLMNNINFGICLGERAWRPLLDKYESKIKWKKTQLKFFGQNKCKIGSCLYAKKGLYEKAVNDVCDFLNKVVV